MTHKTVVVLGTGGTIAGRASSSHDNVGYKAGEVPVAELLGDVPVPAGCRVEAEQVAQIDSKDMSEAVWRRLLQAVRRHLDRVEVAGLVVTHGTDTLEETAYLLQRVFSPAKPVVLVSAMRPASAALRDGPQNLADGLHVATTPGVRGVLAVCAGKLHSAYDVQKAHNYRLDVYDSGDAGPVAVLEEGRLTQWRAWPAEPDAPQADWMPHLLSSQPWPRVEWITSHGGQTGALVRALLQPPADGSPPLAGLVVAGTGNGTVHESMESALVEAQQAGVVVWRTTRCPAGRVIDTGSSRFPSIALPPSKARLALLLDRLAAQSA